MNQTTSTRNITGLMFAIIGVAGIAGWFAFSGQSPESETIPMAQTNSFMDEQRPVEPKTPQLSVESPPAVETQGAQTPPPEARTVVAQNQRESKEPIWKAWPKPPLALMLTGEQHGYFEPCGCTSNQLGGMSRRADLLAKLEGADWIVRGLDVGGLSRRTSRQAALKLDTTLKAMHQLHYDGVGVGTDELKLGVENLLEIHMNMSNLQASVPFISANLEFLGGALDGFPSPSRVIEEGGLKIGVTSVLSEKLKREVLPVPEVSWKEPGPEIEKALAVFTEQSVDVRILLSQGSVDESKAFAEQFPAFDLILIARGIGDPDPAAPPQKVGDTLIIEAGRKGKHVGVLGVYPGEETKLRYQLVSLERDQFDDTPAMVTLMEDYQRQLKEFQIAKEDTVGAPHPSGAHFVGATKCGECHTEAFEIWKDTPHAHAIDSLDPVHKRLGYERLNGVNRSYDPECLACHVTGWDPQEYIRFQSGFLNEEFASTDQEKQLHALLAGTQCENCHGPGSQHIEQVEADADDAGKSVRVTLEQAEKSMCGKCHDADNSPKFEFDEYWKKVEHYGLD